MCFFLLIPVGEDGKFHERHADIQKRKLSVKVALIEALLQRGTPVEAAHWSCCISFIGMLKTASLQPFTCSGGPFLASWIMSAVHFDASCQGRIIQFYLFFSQQEITFNWITGEYQIKAMPVTWTHSGNRVITLMEPYRKRGVCFVLWDFHAPFVSFSFRNPAHKTNKCTGF